MSNGTKQKLTAAQIKKMMAKFMKDQKYLAIQCKFHGNDNYSLSRNDLATCLDTTFNIGKNIEGLYIISNCNSLRL